MWLILGIFFILLILGVPVAFDVGIAAVIYLFVNGKDLIILTQRIFAGGDSFTLMAIPLFIFAGEIMNACGVTKRIVAFANELVGFIHGGLAHVNVLASMLFAGVSGSTSADVASIGGMLIGSMDEAGFDRRYATAVTAASATIGSIIPPFYLDGIVFIHHRNFCWKAIYGGCDSRDFSWRISDVLCLLQSKKESREI